MFNSSSFWGSSERTEEDVVGKSSSTAATGSTPAFSSSERSAPAGYSWQSPKEPSAERKQKLDPNVAEFVPRPVNNTPNKANNADVGRSTESEKVADPSPGGCTIS